MIDTLGITGFAAARVRAEIDYLTLRLVHNLRRAADEAAGKWVVLGLATAAWLAINTVLSYVPGLTMATNAVWTTVAVALAWLIQAVIPLSTPLAFGGQLIDKDLIYRILSYQQPMAWVRGISFFLMGIAVTTLYWFSNPRSVTVVVMGTCIAASSLLGVGRWLVNVRAQHHAVDRLDRLLMAHPRAALLDALLDLSVEVSDAENRSHLRMRAHWFRILERAANVLENDFPQFLIGGDSRYAGTIEVKRAGADYAAAAAALRNLQHEVTVPRPDSWDKVATSARRYAEATARGDFGCLLAADSSKSSEMISNPKNSRWKVFNKTFMGEIAFMSVVIVGVLSWANEQHNIIFTIITALAAVCITVYNLLSRRWRQGEVQVGSTDISNLAVR